MKSKQDENDQRVVRCKKLAEIFQDLPDDKILSLFKSAEDRRSGMGGETATLQVGNERVFCKRLYLSSIELENPGSTDNIFNLPLCYQYGVGSAGFGAWREVGLYRTFSNWVLGGDSENFPMLFHDRVVAHDKRKIDKSDHEKVDRDADYWEGSAEIAHRLRSLLSSGTSVFLFLEFVPKRLKDFVTKDVATDWEQSFKLYEQIENTNRFLQSKGIIHFDPHFWNLLVDKDRIIYNDFGLALDEKFLNSREEREFFVKHLNYDSAATKVNFLFALTTAILGEDSWPQALYSDSLFQTIEDEAGPIAQKLRPISMVMDTFYSNLRFKSKNTEYPHDEVNRLLARL